VGARSLEAKGARGEVFIVDGGISAVGLAEVREGRADFAENSRVSSLGDKGMSLA
jgi:hypothetical protein